MITRVHYIYDLLWSIRHAEGFRVGDSNWPFNISIFHQLPLSASTFIYVFRYFRHGYAICLAQNIYFRITYIKMAFARAPTTWCITSWYTVYIFLWHLSAWSTILGWYFVKFTGYLFMVMYICLLIIKFYKDWVVRVYQPITKCITEKWTVCREKRIIILNCNLRYCLEKNCVSRKIYKCLGWRAKMLFISVTSYYCFLKRYGLSFCRLSTMLRFFLLCIIFCRQYVHMLVKICIISVEKFWLVAILLDDWSCHISSKSFIWLIMKLIWCVFSRCFA